jgi:hypothetical protein
MGPQISIEEKPKPKKAILITSYVLLPVVFYIVTSLKAVNSLTPIIALLVIAALIMSRFFPKKSNTTTVALWVVFVLALVGSTGWFYSPFFFALYLAVIGLGFMYTPSVVIGFTGALIVIFAYSIGEINPLSDFFVLVSLVAVVPTTIVLKRFLLAEHDHKDREEQTDRIG